MGDLIERFLVGIVIGSAWQRCSSNRHLVQDPMLWLYDAAVMQTFERWP